MSPESNIFLLQRLQYIQLTTINPFYSMNFQTSDSPILQLTFVN